MIVGHFDREITLQSPVYSEGGSGTKEIDSWSNEGTVWAKVRFQTGRELLSSQKEVVEKKATCRIRYHDAVEEDWRVIVDGDAYGIENIWRDFRNDVTELLLLRVED